MPDVEIVGTDVVLSFPDAMSQEEILRVLKTHPTVQGLRRQTKPSSDTPITVKRAYEMLGVPYVWGGASCRGTDCSGLIQQLYRKAGIALPRTAREQARYGAKHGMTIPTGVGEHFSTANLRPGDILFFQGTQKGLKPGEASHVGIYVGDGQMVHASSRAGRIVVSDVNEPYYRNRFLQANRLPLPPHVHGAERQQAAHAGSPSAARNLAARQKPKVTMGPRPEGVSGVLLSRPGEVTEAAKVLPKQQVPFPRPFSRAAEPSSEMYDPLERARAEAASAKGVAGFVKSFMVESADPRNILIGTLLGPGMATARAPLTREAARIAYKATGSAKASKEVGRVLPRAVGLGAGTTGAAVFGKQAKEAFEEGDIPKGLMAVGAGALSGGLAGLSARGLLGRKPSMSPQVSKTAKISTSGDTMSAESAPSPPAPQQAAGRPSTRKGTVFQTPDGASWEILGRDAERKGNLRVRRASAPAGSPIYSVPRQRVMEQMQQKPLKSAPLKPPPSDVTPSAVPPSVTPPAAAAPSVAAAPEGGVTGVAKAVTQRPPHEGRSVQQMLQAGQEAVISGRIEPRRVAQDTLQYGKPMSDEDLAAVGYRLRQIENGRAEILGEIQKTEDPMELARLQQALADSDAETALLLDAADLTLNRGFHRLGMAAQIVLDRNFSLRALPQRAKAALMGTPAPKDLDARIRAFQEEDARLAVEMKAAKEEIAKRIREPVALKRPRTDAQRERDIQRIRQYFGREAGEVLPSGVPSFRRTGAVRYTITSAERTAMEAMRRIARDIAPSAKSIDDILNGIRAQTGISMPDEQILRMLSDSYRKFLIEADVNRLKADQYLRTIQRIAQFRLKNPLQKAIQVVTETMNVAARSVQAGFDISAPLRQGRKGLLVNPYHGWVKSWAPMLRALVKGEDFVSAQVAEIERHPMYSRFKAAGGELMDMGSDLTKQQEMFAGNLIRILLEKLPGTAATNPIKTYLQSLQNSQAAYTAFLNNLTWDTFLKKASVAPDNPAYLRDIVSTLDTIFGKGASATARALGRTPVAGQFIFAPRYTLSSWEYNLGRPVFMAETGKGRTEALKVYAAHALTYGAMLAFARMAGWNVQIDPKSADFGKVEVNGVLYDFLSSDSQPFRLVYQMLRGRISQAGKYTPPSGYAGSQLLGQYLMGKAAPLPSLAKEYAFGVQEKQPDRSYRVREMEGADILRHFLPIWVQQGIEDGTFEKMPLLAVPNVMGLTAEEGRVHPPSWQAPAFDFTNPRNFQK